MVIEAALDDAKALESGGAAGLFIENFGDKPFFKTVGAETVAAMTRVVTEVRRECSLAVGVNVLRNDGVSALIVAAATGAEFVRVNVLVGAMVTDQGIIEGEAARVLRKRSELCPDVLVFGDHRVKHAVPVTPDNPLQSAKDLRHRALADAIIVTGEETGAAADAAQLTSLRNAVDAPLLVGSGLSAENAGSYRDLIDGAIVGTSLKIGGDVSKAVDVTRVRTLVAALS